MSTVHTTPKSPAPTTPSTPPKKVPLPAGHRREWYETHNRRLKAMRLAIALLDAGAYAPHQAPNVRIRRTAAHIGVHRPSNATCRVVRSLLPAVH